MQKAMSYISNAYVKYIYHEIERRPCIQKHSVHFNLCQIYTSLAMARPSSNVTLSTEY